VPVNFNVYVDRFNLYKGTLEKRPSCKWLDLISFAKTLNPAGNLIKVYYFTAAVKARFPDDRASDRQHSYLRALEHSGVEVVRGKFHKSEKWKRLVSQERNQTIQPELRSIFGLTQRIILEAWSKAHPDVPKALVYEFEEKGSDVNLASFLLRDAFTRTVNEAYVITGDSDLVSPIKFAVQAGVPTHVIIPGTGRNVNDLKSVASSLRPLDVNVLPQHQFPNTIVTPKGRNITMPTAWS